MATESRELRPREIFIVSFTRASSTDLRRRVHAYCLAAGFPGAAEIRVSTLHSLALRALRAGGMLASFPVEPMVLDEWEIRHIFDAEFCADSGRNPTRAEEIRRQWEAYWSTGGWAPPTYVVPEHPVTEDEKRSFEMFHSPRVQTYSCVLPGEVISLCLEKLKAGVFDPAALLKTRHLIVDEYQDLNPADLELIDHLAASGITLFVAGDDDQSVYSFRYADSRGIQGFPSRYPDAGLHELSDCFRCPPAVTDAATELISSFPLPGRISKGLDSLWASAVPPIRAGAWSDGRSPPARGRRSRLQGAV